MRRAPEATLLLVRSRRSGAGRQHPLTASDSEMTDQLEDALSDAVAARMVADVPVGAFLSGGIDSSTIVALMQRHASVPVRTFTVGFADRSFDESTEAAAVAAHLGTDHTAVHVGDAEAVEVIPDLADIWDEPFADISQIPTSWSAEWRVTRSPSRCRVMAATSSSPATTGTPGSTGVGEGRAVPAGARRTTVPHWAVSRLA